MRKDIVEQAKEVRARYDKSELGMSKIRDILPKEFKLIKPSNFVEILTRIISIVYGKGDDSK